MGLSLQGECLLPTIHFQHESFPIPKDFNNEISDNRNEHDFGVLYFKIGQYLEDLHKS